MNSHYVSCEELTTTDRQCYYERKKNKTPYDPITITKTYTKDGIRYWEEWNNNGYLLSISSKIINNHGRNR